MPVPLIPRLSGNPNMIEIAAIAGIVSPILANADPNAKF